MSASSQSLFFILSLTCVRKQQIIALYFESENELKFYNLEARILSKYFMIILFLFVLQFDTFIEYMFYDFNDDRPDLTTYDIHECFETRDKFTFQVAFPGK